MGEQIRMSTRQAPPCKDCRDRKTGCHDHCERFASWKDSIEKIKAERKKYLSKPFSKIM